MKTFLLRSALVLAMTMTAVSTQLPAFGGVPVLWDTFDPCCSCNKPSPCQPPKICNWFLRADLLIWRAFERDINCDCSAVTIDDLFKSDGSLITDIREKDIDYLFDWKQGCRVGVGFTLSTGWTAELYGTSIHVNAHGHTKNRADHANLKINFTTMDFLISRDFWYNCKFSYAPYMGLRAAWIDQKLNTRLSGSHIVNGVVQDLIFSDFHNKECFWGVGPEIGIELDWHIIDDFTIFANVDIALLYGRFRTKFDDLESVGPVKTTIMHIDRFNTTVPALDAVFGVRWEKEFANGKIIHLQAAWEHHRYIDYNLFGRGDLCLDGASFALNYQF